MRSQAELIDFTDDTPHPAFIPSARLSHGGVHVIQARFGPNPDRRIGARQVALFIHDGAGADLHLRPSATQGPRTFRATAGLMHICPAGRTLPLRWSQPLKVLVAAFEPELVANVARECERASQDIHTEVAVRDLVVEQIAHAWSLEIGAGGPGGGLFTESLGVFLLVHLFRTHRRAPRAAPRGGLRPDRLARVVDYIDANIFDDIALTDLARVAGLSTHHFGGAFRRSTGLPPHRYLMDRRVQRAKTLLRSTDTPITALAASLGFASPSHFTVCFRKATGVTPSTFRHASD